LAETEAAIDESFDAVKKATAEREETMQWLREQMSATKKEVEAVTRKDFDDADALMKTIDKRIKEHNEKAAKLKESGIKTYEPKRFEVNKFEPTKF